MAHTHTHAHSRRNNGTLRHVVVTHNDTHLSIHHCIRTHTTGRTGRSRTAERTLVAIFLFRGGSGETTHCLMQRTIMQFETVQAHAADASGAPHLMLSQLDFTTRQFQRCVMKDQRDSKKRSHLHIAVLRYVLHSPLPCTPLHLLSLSAVLALSISPILSFSLSLSLSCTSLIYSAGIVWHRGFVRLSTFASILKGSVLVSPRLLLTGTDDPQAGQREFSGQFLHNTMSTTVNLLSG
jgi:hypothetical protein